MNLAVFLICVNVGALVALAVGGIWHSHCPYCDPVPKGEFNIEDLK